MFERTSSRFLCCLLLLFELTGGFSSIAFLMSLFSLSYAIARFTLNSIYSFCTCIPAHNRLICITFILNIFGLFNVPRVLWILVGVSYLAFLPHILAHLSLLPYACSYRVFLSGKCMVLNY